MNSVSRLRRFGLLLVAAALLAAALALAACSRPGTSTSGASEADQVIWEAWAAVNESYAGVGSLDATRAAGDIIDGMLAYAEVPHYPLLTRLSDARGRAPATVPQELSDVWRAWTILRVEAPEADLGGLAEAALTGMMASLGDSVSAYLNAEEYRLSQEEEEVSYQGVGAVLSMEDQGLTIMSLMSDGPAERAGLRSGDVILDVDGESVAGKDISEATANIRGPSGDRVTFLIQRPTEVEPREVSITRGTVNVPSVDMSLLPSSVGYIRIQAFYAHTLDEALDALEMFNELETLGVALDLRSAEDGSLEVARDVGAQFLPSGLFSYQVDNQDARTDYFLEAAGVLDPEVMLVVLVNEGTAGAAEALAGALQDAGRGVIMGDPTRGQGSTNSYVTLSNGGALRLPVSYWYTPSGRSISGQGIQPDVSISLTAEDLMVGRDSQLAEAYQYLDSLLPAFR